MENLVSTSIELYRSSSDYAKKAMTNSTPFVNKQCVTLGVIREYVRDHNHRLNCNISYVYKFMFKRAFICTMCGGGDFFWSQSVGFVNFFSQGIDPGFPMGAGHQHFGGANIRFCQIFQFQERINFGPWEGKGN